VPSPRDLAFLNQLASGRKMESVPESLVELGLVKAMRLEQAGGLVSMVWVVTRKGRIAAAGESET